MSLGFPSALPGLALVVLPAGGDDGPFAEVGGAGDAAIRIVVPRSGATRTGVAGL